MSAVVRKFAAALGSALFLLPAAARAVEKEHHLGLTLGPSVLVISDKTSSGAGAGLTYSYGVTDAFNFIAEGGSSLLSVGDVDDKTPHTHPKTLTNAAVGASYVLDILRWVPYGGLLVGGYVLDGGTMDKALVIPGAQLALGLDYKFNFTWSAGVGYRQHLFFSQVTNYPSYSTFFLRVEYAWGQ
jgi:hypothetical protein